MMIACAEDLIRSHEGCVLTAKKDSRGWEIGWGHNGPDVTEGLTWTQEQADTAFVDDFGIALKHAIAALGPDSWQELNPQRRAVLVDMAYELGGAGLDKFRDFLEAMRAKRWPDAYVALLDSTLARSQAPTRTHNNAVIVISGLWPGEGYWRPQQWRIAQPGTPTPPAPSPAPAAPAAADPPPPAAEPEGESP